MVLRIVSEAEHGTLNTLEARGGTGSRKLPSIALFILHFYTYQTAHNLCMVL